MATQHRLLVMEMKAKNKKEKRREKSETIRWRKLKETEAGEYLLKQTETISGMIDEDGANWENKYPSLVELAKEELGVFKPGKYSENEYWCWNCDVQHTVSKKKEKFEKWKLARLEQNTEHC